MQDLMSMFTALRRPRLLIRAARIGAQTYHRTRHLQRVLGYGNTPRPAAALLRLMEIERGLNDRRLADDTGYSLPRHVDLLIAMMGEAALLRVSAEPTTAPPCTPAVAPQDRPNVT